MIYSEWCFVEGQEHAIGPRNTLSVLSFWSFLVGLTLFEGFYANYAPPRPDDGCADRQL